MTTTGTPLRIRGLSVEFQGLRVMTDISLEVCKGITGLIGPNGAGKTTLFNVVSGLVRPVSGKIEFYGADISSENRHRRARRGLGRTFQVPREFASMTVIENIAVAALSKTRSVKQARKKAEGVFEQVELSNYASLNQVAGELTLAGKRRLEVARALAVEPRLILLDEMLGGLGEAETEATITLIQSLHTDGVDVLMVEHRLEIVRTLCQEVAVLHAGNLLFVGTPDRAFDDADVQAAYIGMALEK